MLKRNETLDNFLQSLDKDEQITFLKNIYIQCFDVMKGDRQKTEQMLDQISTPVLVKIDLKNVHKALSKNTGKKKDSIIFVEKQMEKIFGTGINDVKETTEVAFVDDNGYSPGDDTDVTDEEDNTRAKNSPKKFDSKQTISSPSVSENDNRKKIVRDDQLNNSITQCSTLKENNNSNVNSGNRSPLKGATILQSYSVFEENRQNVIQAKEDTKKSSSSKDEPFCKLDGSYSLIPDGIKPIANKTYSREDKKARKIKKKMEKERKNKNANDKKMVTPELPIEEIKHETPMDTTPLSIDEGSERMIIDLTVSDEDDDNNRQSVIMDDSVVDNIPAKSPCSLITSSKSLNCNGDSNEVDMTELPLNEQECQSQPPPLISASLLASCSSLIETAAPSEQQYPNTIFAEPPVSSSRSPSPNTVVTQPQIVLPKEMPKDKTKVITEKIKRLVYENFKFYRRNNLIDRIDIQLKKSKLLTDLDKHWNSTETSKVTELIIHLIWILNDIRCNIVPLMGCFMTLFRRTLDTTELSDVDTYKKFLAFSDVIKRCVFSWNKQFWKTWLFPDSFMYGCCIVDHVLYGGTSRVKSMHHLVNWAKISCIKKYFQMPSFKIVQPEFISSHREIVNSRKTRIEHLIEQVIANKDEPSSKIPKINATNPQTRPPLAITPAISVRPQYHIRNFSQVDPSVNPSYQPNSTIIQHLTSPSISLHTSPFISQTMSQPQANHMMPTAIPCLSNPNMRQYTSFNPYLTHQNINMSIPNHQTNQTHNQQIPTRPFPYNNYSRTSAPVQNNHMHYNSQVTSSPGLPDASSPNMPDQLSTNRTSSASQNSSNITLCHPNDCSQYNMTNSRS